MPDTTVETKENRLDEEKKAEIIGLLIQALEARDAVEKEYRRKNSPIGKAQKAVSKVRKSYGGIGFLLGLVALVLIGLWMARIFGFSPFLATHLVVISSWVAGATLTWATIREGWHFKEFLMLGLSIVLSTIVLSLVSAV